MLKDKIKKYCDTLGLDTVGFIPCRPFDELTPYYRERVKKGLQNEFEAADIEQRINPCHYMPEAKTIISIAFPYNSQECYEDNGFSIYTKRLDYHKVVAGYLEQISLFIGELGGKAQYYVDSNTLPERYIAYLAGIGFMGKNNMLITPQYGSYVFLGEIMTDLKISCEEQRKIGDIAAYKECGECIKCLQECPTKAIHQGLCNPNICLSYLTQKKDLTDKEINLLKGNVFGCDFCQLQCPYNKQGIKSPLTAFRILPYMNEEVSVFATMNQQFFKEKIKHTSCGWRGKNVIKRNALIRMAYEEKDILSYKGESPYINEYVERARRIYADQTKEKST